MKKLMQNDLKQLALGAAVLGSGGGGNPSYEILMASYAIEKNGPITLVSLEDLKEDDLIVPVGFMGAPLVSLERLASGKEFTAILEAVKIKFGREPTYLMPAEIGGANAFAPFLFGLPVLDADTIGRAFPELQMSCCNLKGISPSPTFLADPFGRVTIIEPKNARELEKQGREITVKMGSSALLATYLMSGKEARSSVIPNSYTNALKIGKSLEDGTFLEHANLLARGKIIDIDQKIMDGFLNGTVAIDEGKSTCEIFYQNEYLLAKRGNETLGITPDILTLLEEETLTPISSESLQYGVRCLLIQLPSPKIWKTAEGLEMVGPHYFGYQL